MDLEKRVYTTELIFVFHDIFDILKRQNDRRPNDSIYKAIADETGLNETTVYRYATKELETAPRWFYDYIVRLKDEVKKGRKPAPTNNLVEVGGLKKAYNKVLSVYSSCDSQLMCVISNECKITVAGLRRKLRDNEKRRVRGRNILKCLEELQNPSKYQYSPQKTYSIGQLVYYSDSGLGKVIEKLPPNRIIVKFENRKMEFIEGYIDDNSNPRIGSVFSVPSSIGK